MRKLRLYKIEENSSVVTHWFSFENLPYKCHPHFIVFYLSAVVSKNELSCLNLKFWQGVWFLDFRYTLDLTVSTLALSDSLDLEKIGVAVGVWFLYPVGS